VSASYLLRRSAQLLPAVAAIVVLGFLIVHLSPGDPLLALAGESGDAAYYERARERYGLDQPLPTQLLTYAGRLLRGDLGYSIAQGRPVAELIASRAGATLLLASTALVLSVGTGTAIGIRAARRPGGPVDTITGSAAVAIYAAPVFWLGQLAIIGFSFRLGWFPVQGMGSVRSTATGLGAAADLAHHLVLPAVVLASQGVAVVARLTRHSLVEELDTDHIRAARGRGLSERRLIGKHAMRRALLPVVTIVGGRVGHLLSGAAVVEIVFGWPGLGRLLLTATQTRDTPLLLGVFLVVATTVVVANLLTDLAYALLDPRIDYAS
jgi:peptide/nickel transport system permease protein